MDKTKEVSKNTTIARWKPDFRYQKEKLVDVSLNNCKIKDDSVTDKEAYRVTLASLRGTLSAQGMGSPTVGSYSIPAGEKYDPRTDFSFLNRPDITIVQLDEYIADFKKRLETADSVLSQRIKDELALVEAKKTELLQKKEKDSEVSE